MSKRKATPRPKAGKSWKDEHGELEPYQLRLDQAAKDAISTRADDLHANKAATARAAIKKGLPLITVADVLEETS